MSDRFILIEKGGPFRQAHGWRQPEHLVGHMAWSPAPGTLRSVSIPTVDFSERRVISLRQEAHFAGCETLPTRRMAHGKIEGTTEADGVSRAHVFRLPVLIWLAVGHSDGRAPIRANVRLSFRNVGSGHFSPFSGQ